MSAYDGVSQRRVRFTCQSEFRVSTDNDRQPATGTARVKRGMAEMLKGGVIMDVVTPIRRRSPRTPARSP